MTKSKQGSGSKRQNRIIIKFSTTTWTSWGCIKTSEEKIVAKPVREKLPHVQPVTTMLIPLIESFVVG
jgi:hypothetical protein